MRHLRAADDALVRLDQEPPKQSKRKSRKNRAKSPPMPAAPLDVKSRRGANSESLAGSVMGSLSDELASGQDGPGFSGPDAAENVDELAERYSAIAESSSSDPGSPNGSSGTSGHAAGSSVKANARALVTSVPMNGKTSSIVCSDKQGTSGERDHQLASSKGNGAVKTRRGGEVALEVLQDVVAAAQPGQRHGQNGLPQPEELGEDTQPEALRVALRHEEEDTDNNGSAGTIRSLS